MFRLVSYDEEVYTKEDWNYLSGIAGHTVAEGLRFVYNPALGEIHMNALLGTYFPPDFFKGFAEFVGMEDDTKAGIEFIMQKTKRMIQKMENPEEDYTFDVFEEALFAVAIDYVRDDMDYVKGKRLKVSYPFLGKEREDKVAAELMERFGYKVRPAKRMARKVVRFHEMMLKNDEDENLFFWDRDYSLFFEETFINGIHIVESFTGEQTGYGYDHACEIFTDIGIKAPLRLVGTREANRVANEESRKRVAEILNNMFPVDHSSDTKKLRNADWDDDDLPFS